MIKIYCDGSSRGNPGEGGFGVAVTTENKLITTYGKQYENITNNQAELRGLIWALNLATTDYKDQEVEIYSDSAYCVNMFNSWIHTWGGNNWLNSKKKEVENIELVKTLYPFACIDFPNFVVKGVPGHAGILGNEIADAVASKNQAKLEKSFENHKDFCFSSKIFDF